MLSPEQVQAARAKYGITVEGDTKTPVSSFADDVAAARKADNAAHPIRTALNDAANTVLVKPAIRTSQALASGAGALIGGDFGHKLQDEANKPINIASPIGGVLQEEPQKAFGQGATRQIASDAAKSAAYLAPVGGAGNIAAKVVGGKILGGAAAGAVAGGLSGAAGGLGESLSDTSQGAGDIALHTAEGAGIGAATGGALGGAAGAVGKAAGAIAESRTPEAKLKFITPTSKDIPEEEFKNLVNQGRIAPKTLTKPAQYILSPNEKEVALKYSHVIDREPVNTSINIGNQIADLDSQVGTFLKDNNVKFNRGNSEILGPNGSPTTSQGSLHAHLTDALDHIDDVSIPEERIQKAKSALIKRFIDSTNTDDVHGLWEARKNFDQDIESAFKGSPTLQKEMKIGLRNAVQDFIAEHTPEGQYKGYMHDMSNLYDLRDIVNVKAAKGRGLDALRQWEKANPRTAKILGLTVGALGLGAAGLVGANVVHAGGE